MAAGYNPLRIGMTGGIGSGKSTAASHFQALGVPVLDADRITRELTEPGQPALAEIRQTFGETVFNSDGTLSRPRLREQVFADAGARQTLEAILHPRVYAELAARSATAGGAYVIWVVPLLLETASAGEVDRVLVVDCPESVQISRAGARDQLAPAAIRAIMEQQLSRRQRLAKADDVLLNDSDEHQLAQRVHELHEQYLALAESRLLRHTADS